MKRGEKAQRESASSVYRPNAAIKNNFENELQSKRYTQMEPDGSQGVTLFTLKPSIFCLPMMVKMKKT
jgi:hypothetical protein